MKKVIMVLILGLFSMATWASDFDDLDRILGTEANVKITLGPGMLGMAKMLSADDEEAHAVLSGLNDLSIKVYELDDAVDAADISDWMSDKVRSLAKNGVEEIIKVVEGDERVHIMARVDGMTLSDLSIMVFEAGDEFVFITMDGEIDIANLKNLTSNFDVDIDVLEAITLNL